MGFTGLSSRRARFPPAELLGHMLERLIEGNGCLGRLRLTVEEQITTGMDTDGAGETAIAGA